MARHGDKEHDHIVASRVNNLMNEIDETNENGLDQGIPDELQRRFNKLVASQSTPRKDGRMFFE
ncbi:MAG: hypothetical protein NVS2B14_01150 [Chamaesiphon sp.]